MDYQLTDHFRVDSDLDRTWAFFSSADNLPLITPPWLAFRIQTPPPIQLRQDCILDYTIRWLNFPVRWRTQIIDFTPPHQFIDLQLQGPYTLWLHQHRFTPSDSGTLCQDRVFYKLPAGPLGHLAHILFVHRQLLDIFRYRRQALSRHLAPLHPLQPDVTIHPLV
ncbi:MAG: SRPBCC family protein [Bacillota bacterium]